MKAKQMLAGLLAAAAMASAVALPSFAAQPVLEEENCLGTYVLMNIPYGEFYAAEAEGGAQVDAVSSATRNKPRAGNLAGGSYHVNADGTDITGVTFPVKVLTPFALKGAKQVTDADAVDITVTLRGSTSTTHYAGAQALFENESYAYYVLDEEPAVYKTAWYDIFAKKWHFSEAKGSETVVEGVTGEVTSPARHTDWEIKLNGFELDVSTNAVYGVVATADDGAEYALRHVVNVWRGTEIGFDAEDAYFDGLPGHTITKLVYYTQQGIYVLPVNIAVPVLAAE